MNIFVTLTWLIIFCSIFSYINIKFLKLPNSIGLMLIAVLMSLCILILGRNYAEVAIFKSFVNSFHFSEFLLEYMLCFLLFAGSLHVDIQQLNKQRKPIIAFTMLGVLLATLLIGFALFWLAPLFGFEIPLVYCFLFGALISPTDPIAVLGILKDAKVPKNEEVIITGESLFNDGIGVVVFLTILHSLDENSAETLSFQAIWETFLVEVGGGLLLGFLIGYLGNKLLKSIDHYQTEVMITLAMVMGGYTLAKYLHTSGPLAIVVAGLYVGNIGREVAMSDTTKQQVDTFWGLIDDLLNAFLFVLIGFAIVNIPNLHKYSFLGIAVIFIVLIIRYLSIILPFKLFNFKKILNKNFPLIMTWGGLRGGISIALALSLPNFEHKPLIISITYIVVLFAVLVQGLSLGKLVKYLKDK
jgi:CPA1 family monovalent cation:H+ antiporter